MQWDRGQGLSWREEAEEVIPNYWRNLMEGIKIGDRVAAAVKHRNTSALRVGVVEKIHPPTLNSKMRYTLREDDGLCTVVAATRAVAIERDRHHTMEELYYYRALYNAHAARGWLDSGIPVVKSWKHDDGTMFDDMFIVTATLPIGQVSNHYKRDLWDLFEVPEVSSAPPWDGHDPKIAAERLREALK
jgi:hypothetical protein